VNTTTLLIEILLSGTLAAVWVSMAARLILGDSLRQIFDALAARGEMGGLIAAVGILMIYLLGWMTHFLGESLLDRFFQTPHRDDVYGRAGVPFYYVRTYVFEKASEASIADIQLDRQILRIARATAINLVLIALLLPFQANIDVWRALAISSAALGLAGFMLAYWRQRYRSTFRKFSDVYAVLTDPQVPRFKFATSEVPVSQPVSTSVQKDALASDICAAARKSDNVTLAPFRFAPERRNELLLFFKPEVFGMADDICQEVISLILRHAAQSALAIDGLQSLTGKWLRDHAVMDRHYGYINQMSRSASTMLSSADREEVLRRLEWTDAPADARFLGGHEFLALHPEYNASSLDAFWQTKKSVKLRGGFYVQRFDLNDQTFVLVNGFHPQQLAHYTTDDKRVVVALCHSDTNWSELRDNLIGDTFPERAVPESIRGTLWSRRTEMRLSEISVAFNYVHLSAGPIEGLHEIRNFLGTGLVPDFKLENTVVARTAIDAGVGLDVLQRALSNPQTSRGRDLFSVSENINTRDAIELVKSESI